MTSLFHKVRDWKAGKSLKIMGLDSEGEGSLAELVLRKVMKDLPTEVIAVRVRVDVECEVEADYPVPEEPTTIQVRSYILEKGKEPVVTVTEMPLGGKPDGKDSPPS